VCFWCVFLLKFKTNVTSGARGRLDQARTVSRTSCGPIIPRFPNLRDTRTNSVSLTFQKTDVGLVSLSLFESASGRSTDISHIFEPGSGR